MSRIIHIYLLLLFLLLLLLRIPWSNSYRRYTTIVIVVALTEKPPIL